MKKRTRRIVMAILCAVMLVSGGMGAKQLMEYQRGEEDYAQAEELVHMPDLSQLPAPEEVLPPPSPAPQPEQSSGEQEEGTGEEPEEEKVVWVDPYADALRDMDFNALREVNDEVLGWILLPGTWISYPLMAGEDNEYYLDHTWRGSRSSVGAIFLEEQCEKDLGDFNTIIYGHRMNNNSMFGRLNRYKDLSYAQKHPWVYITGDNGTHQYQIFAAYEVAVMGETYRILFRDDEEKQTFIDFCLEQSVIDTGVVPQIWDKIVTLSTCTGRGHDTRWVVQAVERGTPPPPPEEPAPEEIPTVEEQPAPGEIPAVEEQPAPEEIPAVEDPLPEEPPAGEEQPPPEEKTE